MRKELVTAAVGLIAVLVISWIVATWVKEEALIHVLVALIGVLAEVLIIMIFSAHETEKSLSEIQRDQQSLRRAIADRVAPSERLAVLLRHHDVVLTRPQMQQVWLDLLNQLRGSYRATNYIDSRRIYDTDWGQAALFIQNGKKRGQQTLVTIQKVFLIDQPEEVAILSSHLEEQRKIGVELEYLYRQEVDADAALASELRNLQSVDFGIFDDEHVLLWDLEGRNVTGGRVLFGKAAVEKYSGFFDHLYAVAKAKHGQEVLLLPLRKETQETIDHWPDYDVPYTELTYALRAPGGWLYTFGHDPKCLKYGVYVGGALVAFTLLDRTGAPGEAEFYVAVHPQKVKGGYGRRATDETLRVGFEQLGLKRIFLKVRRDHAVGKKLYTKAGFQTVGSPKTLEINGKMTEFDLMEITADRYRAARD